MKLNEYQCDQEGHFFHVEDGVEPIGCPVCGTPVFDWTRDVEIV